MTLEPASGYTFEQLATLFERGYEGYFVPVHMDAATLESVVGSWDIALERSRVAVADGAPVGLAFLAVRDDRGWIGGIGVVPEARRCGIGRALLEAVLEDAPATVQLEVIEANDPARKLYEQLGFETRRMLEVWTFAAETPSGPVRDTEPHPLGQEGLPWQREDRSLPQGIERIEVDGGAIVFRVKDGHVGVAQLAARDESVAMELVGAARSRGERLTYVNVPEGDPVSGALRRLGATLDLRQFEMVLSRS